MTCFSRGRPIVNYTGPRAPAGTGLRAEPPMTFTGVIGNGLQLPAPRDHRASAWRCASRPNVLTFTGVVVNVTAAWLLGTGASGRPGS